LLDKRNYGLAFQVGIAAVTGSLEPVEAVKWDPEEAHRHLPKSITLPGLF
jgi:hypothetical protein